MVWRKALNEHLKKLDFRSDSSTLMLAGLVRCVPVIVKGSWQTARESMRMRL